MDPLSITTGIITVLQATGMVISICYDFKSALNKAPWALSRIVEELKGLRTVLEALEIVADNLQSGKSSYTVQRIGLELLCKPGNGLLELCGQALTSLEKSLTNTNWGDTSGPKRRALAQAIGWRLSEKDALEALGNIQRFKSTLSLALAADQVYISLPRTHTSLFRFINFLLALSLEKFIVQQNL
jgi:hypothetical protein